MEKLITGHEADVNAVAEEIAEAKANWARLTDAQKNARIEESHAKFNAEMSAIGEKSFW